MKKFFSPIIAVLKVGLIKLGHIQARVLLFLLYYLIVVPTGLLAGCFSDFLKKKKPAEKTLWNDKAIDSDIHRFSRKQY